MEGSAGVVFCAPRCRSGAERVRQGWGSCRGLVSLGTAADSGPCCAVGKGGGSVRDEGLRRWGQCGCPRQCASRQE